MKNNKMVGMVVALVVIVLLGSGYYVMSQKSSQTTKSVDEEVVEEEISSLTAADVGLTFEFRPDKKAVRLSLSKIEDIEAAEYEIIYKYEEDDIEKDEALIGELRIEEGDDSTQTDYRDLGTCSSGVCRYQNVTSDIKLILKITKKDGKRYMVEDTLKH